MAEFSRALEVRLRKIRPMAPPFHQHIARKKMLGRLLQNGDRIVVYEVVETVPGGPVLVTEDTLIRYEPNHSDSLRKQPP